MVESFSSPFLYFVFLQWSFFIMALLVYITVFYLTHWKQFYQVS